MSSGTKFSVLSIQNLKSLTVFVFGLCDGQTGRGQRRMGFHGMNETLKRRGIRSSYSFLHDTKGCNMYSKVAVLVSLVFLDAFSNFLIE